MSLNAKKNKSYYQNFSIPIALWFIDSSRGSESITIHLEQWNQEPNKAFLSLIIFKLLEIKNLVAI